MARNRSARRSARQTRLPVRPRLERLEDRLVMDANLDLTGVVPRTINGVNNNPLIPTQGAAETRQIRFGYGDDFPDDPNGVGGNGFGDIIIRAPNARTVSNAILRQLGNTASARRLTDWSFQWGQWVTHDIDLTRTGREFDRLSTGVLDDFSIPVVDPGDPFGVGTRIPFNRSQFDNGQNTLVPSPPTGVPGQRREVVNRITSYIDASNVYASDQARLDALRTFQNGKLKTSANGQLLPLNTGGLENADALGLGAQLFLAGDVRANEQLNLTAVHTLFVREHNRLATRIHNLYPSLDDEQIFQIARRIVGAEQQIITYEEYLPSLLGYDLAPDPDAYVYNPNVNASVTNAFAHSAFRFGHSQINEATLLVNDAGETTRTLSIRDAFFNPQFLKDDPARVGRMLKGLASQRGQEVDVQLVDGIRNNLFGPPGAGGLDLGSLDIQRSRDHGLPDYNNLLGAFRALGLQPDDGDPATPRVPVTLTSFAQISGDPNAIDGVEAALAAQYGSIDTIDSFVGFLAETHLPGSSVGRTLNAIIGNQFSRLRDGDSYFYTGDAFLQSDGVKAIINLDKVSLSKIIRLNTQIDNIQDNVFFDRSVVVIKAPDAGSNLSVVAGAGVVSVIDNQNGEVLALRSLDNVEQVIIAGSTTSADVFNLFIAAANGGLEGGVVAYGGGSMGDRLNVFGLPLVPDTFTVADTSFSTGSVGVLARGGGNPAENAITQSVSSADVTVNGNAISASGFETLRLVTLTPAGTVNNPDNVAIQVVTVWDPLSSN
jgi:peroxidase